MKLISRVIIITIIVSEIGRERPLARCKDSTIFCKANMLSCNLISVHSTTTLCNYKQSYLPHNVNYTFALNSSSKIEKCLHYKYAK